MDRQYNLFDYTRQPFKITNKIRLIELFAGVGSQAMALRDIGADFEHYRVVEFDKYAIASYNAIHGTNFETMDIRNVYASDLGIVDTDNYTYIVTYSFPCFTEDTFILTDNGLKYIKDVKVGDNVLTHDNSYHKVIASSKTGRKNIYKISGMSIDEIKCTENHKFFVRKKYYKYPTYENGKRGHERHFSAPEWIECKNLNKDYYLGIAVNQNNNIPSWDGVTYTWNDGRKDRHKNNLSPLMSNAYFWWLIGRWVGDGWYRYQGGIIICCNKTELSEITDCADNINIHYNVVEEPTVYKIHFPDKELEAFVLAFGNGAKNKRIPGFVFDMPDYLLKSFVKGYISADGCKTNNVYKVSSISRELIYGVAQLVAKVYKTPYRIYRIEMPSEAIIEGRTVKQNISYQLVFKTEKRKQDKAFYEDGYIWCPISKIENTNETKDVYDIEVENAHSFTANGIIAHNCQDLSVAGKRAGMSRGGGYTIRTSLGSGTHFR